MSESNSILSQRRLVIIFQLAILLFILGGLFSTMLVGKKQSATVTNTVELKDAPLKGEARVGEIPQKLSDVTVRGKAAYVWDIRAKRALYTKNESEALPLASITKLMTALLAHELAAGDTEVKLSLQAVSQEGSNGLVAGEDFTLEQLNKLALITSSNDAAYAMGASVGTLLGDKDPARQFVEGMNIKAEELGFKSLSFKNTTGLDLSPSEPGAIGSAKDVSLLMEYILTNYPELIESTTLGGARIYNSQGEFHDIDNTNEALYAIPNILGSKTGYTDLAGGNLTVAFDAGHDRPIIVTVLGSTREERFTDVLRLVNAVRANISEL
jgi:serine-type D-Ala-D-Ala carboxypeptidase (penicillin-binding protein 5/6)